MFASREPARSFLHRISQFLSIGRYVRERPRNELGKYGKIRIAAARSRKRLQRKQGGKGDGGRRKEKLVARNARARARDPFYQRTYK